MKTENGSGVERVIGAADLMQSGVVPDVGWAKSAPIEPRVLAMLERMRMQELTRRLLELAMLDDTQLQLRKELATLLLSDSKIATGLMMAHLSETSLSAAVSVVYHSLDLAHGWEGNAGMNHIGAIEGCVLCVRVRGL